ncbi:MAG: polysaccharide deacetylase family protein [Alphaproteobacteria bacterium]|nr:polysaccharide deacetylase family protein [Alphaproteobacteria bacterium]
MRTALVTALVLGTLAGLASSPAMAAECALAEAAVGLERVVEVDASGGPLFGGLTHQQNEPTFLRDKEVVLTFDDGPSPWVTPKILDTLESHCTKATFFSVGRMAVSYPDVVRDVLARGHTVGGHTWSHPRQLPKMKLDSAQAEIERGFAALEAATGGGIAPFFRFTGLNDSAPLLKYLQTRGIATFTVDVVSDDSFIASPGELARITLQRLENRGGGILLFHDIKPATAEALPAILDGLKERGYRVVHLRYRTPVVAEAELVKGFKDQVAEKLAKSQRTPRLMPFYGAISELSDDRAAALAAAAPPVTRIAPEARDRTKRPPVVLKTPATIPTNTGATKTGPKPVSAPKAAPAEKPIQGAPQPPSGANLPWKSSASRAYRDAAPEAGGWSSAGSGAASVDGPGVR